MLVVGVGEFKSKFSELLKKVQAGEEIGITFGKNKEVVARLLPKKKVKQKKRKIGILDSKAVITFKKGFKMTEREFSGV